MFSLFSLCLRLQLSDSLTGLYLVFSVSRWAFVNSPKALLFISMEIRRNRWKATHTHASDGRRLLFLIYSHRGPTSVAQRFQTKQSSRKQQRMVAGLWRFMGNARLHYAERQSARAEQPGRKQRGSGDRLVRALAKLVNGGNRALR